MSYYYSHYQQSFEPLTLPQVPSTYYNFKPHHLLYTKYHELTTDKKISVGFTGHSQIHKHCTNLKYLVKPGSDVKANRTPMLTVEFQNEQFLYVAPISGTVSQLNDKLVGEDQDLTLVQEDPLVGGWLIKIEVSERFSDYMLQVIAKELIGVKEFNEFLEFEESTQLRIPYILGEEKEKEEENKVEVTEEEEKVDDDNYSDASTAF